MASAATMDSTAAAHETGASGNAPPLALVLVPELPLPLLVVVELELPLVDDAPELDELPLEEDEEPVLLVLVLL